MNNRRRTAWFRRPQGPPFIEHIGAILATGDNKWIRGVYDGNGKIYGIPRTATQLLVIDTISDNVYTTGSLGTGNKWMGGTLAPNGKIYCVPDSDGYVLEIDPSDDSTARIGILVSGNSRFWGSVLAPNGKIYGIPRHHTRFIEIDPISRTTVLIGPSFSGFNKWRCGFLGSNGNVFGVPSSNTNFVDLDISSLTTSLIATSASGAAIANGAFMSQDGNAYSFNEAYTKPIKLDVSSSVVTELPISPTTFRNNGTYSPDGYAYSAPLGGNILTRLDVLTEVYENIDARFNMGGYSDLVLAPNGSIYGIPYSGTRVLKINQTGSVSSDMFDIPSDLSTLPGSLYNTYQNR